VSPTPVHRHQAATSLLSLPLPGVLTSDHINRIDDHRKGVNHTQSYKQGKGKLVQKGSYIITLNIRVHSQP